MPMSLKSIATKMAPYAVLANYAFFIVGEIMNTIRVATLQRSVWPTSPLTKLLQLILATIILLTQHGCNGVPQRQQDSQQDSLTEAAEHTRIKQQFEKVEVGMSVKKVEELIGPFAPGCAERIQTHAETYKTTQTTEEGITQTSFSFREDFPGCSIELLSTRKRIETSSTTTVIETSYTITSIVRTKYVVIRFINNKLDSAQLKPH